LSRQHGTPAAAPAPGFVFRSEFATVDDTRGFAVGAGHEAEHLWDSVF
jgi:hypothetical protein